MDIWNTFWLYASGTFVLALLMILLAAFGFKNESYVLIGLAICCAIADAILFFTIGMPLATEMINSGDPIMTWLGVNMLSNSSN